MPSLSLGNECQPKNKPIDLEKVRLSEDKHSIQVGGDRYQMDMRTENTLQ
jgi:hypothetical protein